MASAQAHLWHEGREPRLYIWDRGPPGRIRVLEVTESYLCQYAYGSHLEEPYPKDIRLIGTIESFDTSWGKIDRAVLRRLRLEAGVGN